MNFYMLGSVLNMASLLMVGGCGAMLCIRGGHFNLGGEGQVYAGGFLASVLLSKFGGVFPVAGGAACSGAGGTFSRLFSSAGDVFSSSESVFSSTGGAFSSSLFGAMMRFSVITVCFFASGFFSALLAFVSALLKKYKNVDVLLSSFLVSSAVIPIVDSLVAGPLRGKTNNLLATDFIPPQYRFSSILPPSNLNATFFIAIGFCVALHFTFKKSSFGKELAIYGISARFALYSGFSDLKLNFISICASGFFHGIVGMFAVCGTYFSCHQGFYAGLGWNSLSVALLSFGNPLLLMFASLLVSSINIFSNQTALLHNFGFDLASLLQGVILFLIVIAASPIPGDFFAGLIKGIGGCGFARKKKAVLMGRTGNGGRE